MRIPNPGSEDAILQGCTCPVLDNCHGEGYYGQSGIFVYTAGCPVHTWRSEMRKCGKGLHNMTEENTYIRPGDGTKQCRECQKLSRARYNQKKKKPRCPKCDSKEILFLYRPWFVDDPYEAEVGIAPCMDEDESTPCPRTEHLHLICSCSYWWWEECYDANV